MSRAPKRRQDIEPERRNGAAKASPRGHQRGDQRGDPRDGDLRDERSHAQDLYAEFAGFRREHIELYDYIGCSVINILANTLLGQVRGHAKEAALAEEYANAVQVFVLGIRSGREEFGKVMRVVLTYYCTASQTTLSYGAFVDRVAQTLVPPDLYPAFSTAQKDELFEKAMCNLFAGVAAFLVGPDVFRALVRKDAALPLQLKREAILTQVKHRELNYSAFLGHTTGVRDQVPPSLLEKLKRTLALMQQERLGHIARLGELQDELVSAQDELTSAQDEVARLQAECARLRRLAGLRRTAEQHGEVEAGSTLLIPRLPKHLEAAEDAADGDDAAASDDEEGRAPPARRQARPSAGQQPRPAQRPRPPASQQTRPSAAQQTRPSAAQQPRPAGQQPRKIVMQPEEPLFLAEAASRRAPVGGNPAGFSSRLESAPAPQSRTQSRESPPPVLASSLTPTPAPTHKPMLTFAEAPPLVIPPRTPVAQGPSAAQTAAPQGAPPAKRLSDYFSNLDAAEDD